MKVLLQRVKRASVRAGGRTVGSIDQGLLIFLGVEREDSAEDVQYFADKAAELRVFPDTEGRMNLSVEDVGGAVLVVSQFTLAAETRRGRRPSYSRAADPAIAQPLYLQFLQQLRDRGLTVESGVFRAMMQVELINDGPVTVLLDPPNGRVG